MTPPTLLDRCRANFASPRAAVVLGAVILALCCPGTTIAKAPRYRVDLVKGPPGSTVRLNDVAPDGHAVGFLVTRESKVFGLSVLGRRVRRVGSNLELYGLNTDLDWFGRKTGVGGIVMPVDRDGRRSLLPVPDVPVVRAGSGFFLTGIVKGPDRADAFRGSSLSGSRVDVTDLGPGYGEDVSPDGDVVGLGGGSLAALWKRDQNVFTPLAPGWAFAINDLGLVGGQEYFGPSVGNQGFVRSSQGELPAGRRPRRLPSRFDRSRVDDLMSGSTLDYFTAVGVAGTDDELFDSRAIWSRGGRRVSDRTYYLGALDHARRHRRVRFTRANAINLLGDVVGEASIRGQRVGFVASLGLTAAAGEASGWASRAKRAGKFSSDTLPPDLLDTIADFQSATKKFARLWKRRRRRQACSALRVSISEFRSLDAQPSFLGYELQREAIRAGAGLVRRARCR